MLTPSHSQESLARAYIHAIAGRVGLTCSFRDFDYGIDLTLHPVTVRTDPATGKRRYIESGWPLDIQVKSSAKTIIRDDGIGYDLEMDAYNDLRNVEVSVPRILVLHVQPAVEGERLKLTDEGLILGGHCYWMSLYGQPAKRNRSRIRVHIPRTNLLSAASLADLMQRVRGKEPL